MSDASAQNPPHPGVANDDTSVQDWATIWQSEMTALAADREGQELWAAGVAHWAAQVTGALASLVGRRDDAAHGRTRPDAPPRPSAAATPSDAVTALERRVADLESRLAGHDSGRDPGR